MSDIRHTSFTFFKSRSKSRMKAQGEEPTKGTDYLVGNWLERLEEKNKKAFETAYITIST